MEVTKEKIIEILRSKVVCIPLDNTRYDFRLYFDEVAEAIVSQMQLPVKPASGVNDLENWEVYITHSDETGIFSNYPAAGDTSVRLKNKITNEVKYFILSRLSV